MTKLLAALAIAALTASIAGASAAATLNPQPLPPRCVAGQHCGRATTHMMLRHHCRTVRHHRTCRR